MQSAFRDRNLVNEILITYNKRKREIIGYMNVEEEYRDKQLKE